MPAMETENSNTSRAEDLKQLANEAFKGHKYSQAIDLYTQAIELNGENAVYWANRAFAHTKLEEYGSAIQDGTKAIEIDPRYSKGYYRRGAAYLAMGKFKDALKDFQQVKKLCPNDPDAAKKLKECEKAVMKLKFEEAISVPESQKRSVADSIDYHTIGSGPGSSYVSTKVTAVSAAAAVMAVLVVYMGTKAATMVAAAASAALLMVLITFRWGLCSDGFFTKSRTLELVFRDATASLHYALMRCDAGSQKVASLMQCNLRIAGFFLDLRSLFSTSPLKLRCNNSFSIETGVDERRYGLRGSTSSSYDKGKEVATSTGGDEEVEDDEHYGDTQGIEELDNLNELEEL
ncbi:Serine/threonine-protein phosphatase 5 [Capsicum annuum]|nr:Serine/threonine-protein phosphatase 5 [Capsicum annuum]